jgi:hypothetical protein
MSPCNFFLNSTIIASIIPPAYTEESFLSANLRMYFIVRLILSIISSVKVIRHCIIWFLFNFYFFTAIRSVYTERIYCRYLPMDIRMKILSIKGYCNIPMEVGISVLFDHSLIVVILS